jgi:hypothetical protein
MKMFLLLPLFVSLPLVGFGKSVKVALKEIAASVTIIETVPNFKALGIKQPYKLVYKQDFDGNEAKVKEGFWFTNPNNWKVPAIRGESYIDFVAKGNNYKYKVRSPYVIGLVKEVEVKDFVLEAELQQTGKEYGHRDMCVFYGFQDRSHFYYTHIASVTDAHAHNCFIVNDKPRTKISHETTKGHKWGAKDWHQVRLIREHGSGKIEVYVNDMKNPIMRATDKTFDWGRVGFGTFDDTGRVRKIRLYAPESRKSKAGDPFVEGRKK